jgi:hypothetical protein
MNDPRNPSMPEDLSVNGDPLAGSNPARAGGFPGGEHDVDDLASDVLDGSLSSADIPEALRLSVLARAAIFDQHRQALLDIGSTIDDESIERAVSVRRQHRSRRVPRFVGYAAAAASFVLLSGLVINQLGNNNSADFITTDAQMAFSVSSADEAAVNEANQMPSTKTESSANESGLASNDVAQTFDTDASVMNGQIIEVQSVGELMELSASWPIEELAQESARETSATTCVTDPDQRLITRRARLQGKLVEIYQTATGGLVVYAQGDCALIARLGS